MNVEIARPVLCIFSRIKGLSDVLLQKRPNVVVRNILAPAKGEDLAFELREQLSNAELMVADPGLLADYNLTQDLPNLKWMQSTWAGVDYMLRKIDHDKPLPSYTITRLGGIFGLQMAEFVMAQLIGFERNFSRISKQQASKTWNREDNLSFRVMSELTLGILGAGDIGKQIAMVSKAFGMNVWGLCRRDVPKDVKSPYFDEMRNLSGLEELLKACDCICNVLPSTPESKGLLSKDMLSNCKEKKPLFINIGRGDVIDEESIVHALSEGWISHAVLDVLDVEPLPSTSALWDHPKVTVTPHVAAVSFAWQICDLIAENYDNYVKKQPLKYIVNLDSGY